MFPCLVEIHVLNTPEELLKPRKSCSWVPRIRSLVSKSQIPPLCFLLLNTMPSGCHHRCGDDFKPALVHFNRQIPWKSMPWATNFPPKKRNCHILHINISPYIFQVPVQITYHWYVTHYTEFWLSVKQHSYSGSCDITSVSLNKDIIHRIFMALV